MLCDFHILLSLFTIADAKPILLSRLSFVHFPYRVMTFSRYTNSSTCLSFQALTINCWRMSVSLLIHVHIALHTKALYNFTIQLRLTLYSGKAIIFPYRIVWSWHTGRWWMGCYNWYSEEGTGRGFIAVPNVTVQSSKASVPITVLLCNGPFLCGFNVPYVHTYIHT